jgi:hypothetical protein
VLMHVDDGHGAATLDERRTSDEAAPAP